MFSQMVLVTFVKNIDMHSHSVALPLYFGNIAIDDAYGSHRAFDTIFSPLLQQYPGYHFVGVVLDLGGVNLDTLNSYPVEVIISDNPQANNPRSIQANVSISELFRLCKNVELRIGSEDVIENNILNPRNIEPIAEE